MKKLITADEVREGDLVRLECVDEETVEGRAQYDGRGRLGYLLVMGFRVAGPNVTAIYLLDRPAPPKIPADAEYVTWVDGHDTLRVACKRPGTMWRVGGIAYTLDELLGRIGDAEVTVLVPKEGQS